MLGLGNPGARYRWTRHNLGFRVGDRLAERMEASYRKSEETGHRAWTAEVETPGGLVVLAKPRDYMNRSGRAALALCSHYSVDAGELTVIYDDADLPLGGVRLRAEGGSGGHRGVRSIIDTLGTGGFARVRLGMRGEERDDHELADYALQPFTPDEERIVEGLVELGTDAACALLADGLASAMNRFNGRSAEDEDAAPGIRSSDTEDREQD